VANRLELKIVKETSHFITATALPFIIQPGTPQFSPIIRKGRGSLSIWRLSLLTLGEL
jgi:hypothetical protein